MKNVGWICPRCDKVHAPSVLTCNCKKEESLNVPPDLNYPETITIPKRYLERTCGNCDRTNGIILTTHPSQIRCSITGELHFLDHICDVEKAEITGTAETATNSTMAGSGGLVK